MGRKGFFEMKLRKIISLCAATALAAVPAEIAKAADEDIVFFEDFEGAAIGERPEKMNSGIDAQTVKYTVEGSSDIYVCDDGEGNKALKITIDDKKAEFAVPFGTALESGTYVISMDMWLQNDSRHFERLMVPRDTYNFSAVTWLQTAKGKWCPKWVGYGSECDIENYSTYSFVECVLNCDSRTAEFYVDGKLIGTDKNHVPEASAKGITSLWFLGKNDTANNGKSTGAGVYLIDNITVRKNVVSVKSTVPKNGEVSADADGDIRFEFTNELKPETVTADTVTLYEEGVPLAKDSYSVSVSGKEVVIGKKSGMEYNTNYRVEFSDGIGSVSGIEVKPQKYGLEFKTEELIPQFSGILEDGAVYDAGYKIELPDSAEIKYTIYVDSEIYDGGVIAEGAHVVRVTAEDSRGRKQSKEYKIETVGARAPEARDVAISGRAVTGGTVTAVYTFSDVNKGDKEGESIFKWYRSPAKDGTWEPIKEAGGEEGKTYILTPADENCFIKLSVTPVSDNEPKEGQPAESEPFMGDFAPVVLGIKIEGTAAVGNELSAKYEYYDANGDEEGDSECGWYAKGADDADYKLVAAGKTYTVTEDADGVFFVFRVTPKSKDSAAKAKEYQSDAVKGPFAPEARGAKIIGETKAGKTVSVSYVFYDENGDGEGETIIKWFVNGKETAQGASLYLTTAMIGTEVYAEITPVSVTAPTEGKTVKTDAVKVAKNTVTTGGSGGTKSGSGGSGSLPPQNPDPGKNDPDEPKQDDKPRTVFADMANHWAKDAVAELVEKGILKGVSEDRFAPQNAVKRAECAAIAQRAFGLSDTAEKTIYGDCKSDDWFFDSVAAVSNAGYMKGADGLFRPNDPITREELAVLMVRICQEEVKPAEENVKFADSAEISPWAAEYVGTAAALGLVNGDENGNFNPRKTATRAETAVCIKRLLDLKK